MNNKNTKYWIMGAIAVIIVIFLSFPFFLAKSRLNAEIAKLRKEGLPTTPREFADKYYKPIPENENAAETLKTACSLLNDPENDYRLIIRGSVRSPRLDQKLAPELLAEVKKDVQNNSEFFEEIEKVKRYDSLHFDYDWKSILTMTPGRNNKLRKAMNAYSLKTELAINNNAPNQAVKLLNSLLHFSYLAGQEPTILGQLVFYACESITLNSLERCMNNLSFSGLDLKSFDKDFDKHEQLILEQWPKKMLARLTLSLTYINFTKLNSLFKKNHIDDHQLLLVFFHYAGRIHNDLANEIKLIRRLMEIPLDVYAKRKLELEKIVVESDKLKSIEMISSTNACQKVYQKALEIIARLRCAKTACAVQRFRLKHGKLPDKLNQLVPEFLAKVPIDPFDGKELRYFKGSFDVRYEIPSIPKKKCTKSERDAAMFGIPGYEVTYKSIITKKKGFCIYSVGKNLIDDKGDLLFIYSYRKKDISFTVIDKK